MTQLGETKRGYEIGRGESDCNLYVWHACMDCGKERWVVILRGEPKFLRCHHCGSYNLSGEQSRNWKGGRIANTGGYIQIKLQPDDFFYPMAQKSHYVTEHRLVMAKHKGRCLQPWEIVHHKNRIKDDNRIENLQLVSDDEHKQITILENKIARLEYKVREQGKLIKLLQWQNKKGVETEHIVDVLEELK